MAKLPAFQFYPGDWLRDGGLRSCTAAARGLWIDLLCWMHDAPQRGRLVKANGNVYTPAELGRMAGCTSGQAQKHVAELEASGVLSRDEQGVIFSRRMVSDEENRRRSADNGKLGGNPALTGRGTNDATIVVVVDKGGVKGGVGSQVADVSNLESTPSSSSSSSSSSSNTVADAEPPAEATDPKPGKAKPHKPRARNALFDAVAEVTASDPVVTGSHVAKVAGLLATAEPPYSPEEVHEFGRRFAELCPYSKIDGRGRPTLGELEKNIGKVRATPVKVPTRTYDALD